MDSSHTKLMQASEEVFAHGNRHYNMTVVMRNKVEGFKDELRMAKRMKKRSDRAGF